MDKNKVYKIKNNLKIVCFDNSYFIRVYGFQISGNILNDKYNYSDKKSMDNYFEGFTDDFELTNGDKEFQVKKFEVYQLI